MSRKLFIILFALALIVTPSFALAVTFGSSTLPTPASTPTPTLPSGGSTPTPTAGFPTPTPLTTPIQTPIVVAQSGDPGQISTGPGEAAVLALVMSLIASLLYVGYSYTPAYRRNEAEKYAKEGAREGKNIDFKS